MKRNQRRTGYIPSISRSGGLDDEGSGNMLKDPAVQEQFFRSIEDRVATHWKQSRNGPDVAMLKNRKEEEASILLELRKIREGIVSTSRDDFFAIRVYELSFYLSVAFDSISHFQSVASRLIDTLYQGYSRKLKTDKANEASTDSETVISVYIASLLHQEFPAQSGFQRRLLELTPRLSEKHASWLRSLGSATIQCNAIRLHELLSLQRTKSLFTNALGRSEEYSQYRNAAISAIAGKLRNVCRTQSWEVTRCAYRELTQVDIAWASKVLLIDDATPFPDWIKEKELRGELVPKPNADSTWSIPRKSAITPAQVPQSG